MRFCPKVEGPCVKQNCMSFNLGINISVMDASKMMSFIVDYHIPKYVASKWLEEQLVHQTDHRSDNNKKRNWCIWIWSFIIGIDVGFCSHFGKVIEDDDFVEDVKLMVEGRELLTKEELSEETSNIHSKNMLKMEG